jgi:hypothetical protein
VRATVEVQPPPEEGSLESRIRPRHEKDDRRAPCQFFSKERPMMMHPNTAAEAIEVTQRLFVNLPSFDCDPSIELRSKNETGRRNRYTRKAYRAIAKKNVVTATRSRIAAA